METFLLASKSPQRAAILTRLGVPFTVCASHVHESAVQEMNPEKRAKVLAEMKAHSVAMQHPDQWVIGADTLVVSANGELLEKPCDAADAERMLRLHSGRTSLVLSALSLQRDGEILTKCESASVTFRDLSDEQIARWIETGLWRDRSGAFQLEGEGKELIQHFEGEEEAIIGFPVRLFWELYGNLTEG